MSLDRDKPVCQRDGKHRRQRHRESKRHQVAASKRGLIQNKWSLIITYVLDEHIGADQVYKFLSIRWGIEIQFRDMKQSSQLHHSLNHRTDPFLIEALVMAVLIRQLLTIDLQDRLIDSLPEGKRVKIEKLSDAHSHCLLTRTRWNLKEPFRYDLRHLIPEKRKRPTLYAATLRSFT